MEVWANFNRSRRRAGSFALPPALAGLLCTGCPAGADLDTPYTEYVVVDNTINVTSTQDSTGSTSTTTAGGTTGGMMGCANAAPELVFEYCAASICHGESGKVTPNAAAGLDLFAPDARTVLLDRPATGSMEVDCSAEKIIDTRNPAASLLITSVKHMAPCGLKMPVGRTTPDPAEVQCITEWVNAVVAGP